MCLAGYGGLGKKNTGVAVLFDGVGCAISGNFVELYREIKFNVGVGVCEICFMLP